MKEVELLEKLTCCINSADKIFFKFPLKSAFGLQRDCTEGRNWSWVVSNVLQCIHVYCK